MFVPKLFPSGFFDIVETSQDPDVHGTTSTVTAFTRYLPGGWRSFAAKALVYTCLMRLADLSDDDPLKFYLRELATVQPLTSRERADLLKQIRSGNNQAEQAEKRLIEANLSMVVVIAERFRSLGCPMLDLIQAGNEGLLIAVESFTGESGDNFSAYAASCIESALSKAVFESQSE